VRDAGDLFGLKSALDEELAAFIRGSLTSVWALELLLLLKRTQPRRWSTDELVREMRASEPLVANALAGLLRAGAVACDAEGCEYSPAAAPIAEICDRVEAAYKATPVAVVNAILAAPKTTLETFADAFRVKGWGEGK
jgi:hypothetical protein